MKKVLKWLGIILGVIVGIALIAFLGYYAYWYSQARRTYDIEVETFPIPTDEASIARGKILVQAVRCTECHGKDLAGQVWTDRLITGKFGSANLTPGENGTADYTDADFIRAIRHGVDPDGKPLIYMPANFYQPLDKEDLGAIIAYIKTLPPSEEPGPPNTTGPYLWKIVLNNPQGLPAVKLIDHSQTAVPDGPDKSNPLEYGAYLTLACRSCHGQDFAGMPWLERLRVPSPNITPYKLGDWTEEDFFKAMREGQVPDGSYIPQTLMPWEAIGQLSDEELHAIWTYLQSLPPVADEDAIAYQTSGE